MPRIFIIPILVICFSLVFYPKKTTSFGNGSPGGKTGSLGDGLESCSSCHYAGEGQNASISSNIPASGYIPGETYTINLSINQNNISKFGFEITAENQQGDKKGIFLITNTSETKTTNNNTAVTHTASGVNGINNEKNWSFDWVAPGFAASDGEVIFYSSLIAANGDGQNTGDTKHSASLTVQESTSNTKFVNKRKYLIIAQNKIFVNKKDIHQINIYDISGKLILNKNKPKLNEVISLDSYSKNIYLIKLIDKQGEILLSNKIKVN